MMMIVTTCLMTIRLHQSRTLRRAARLLPPRGRQRRRKSRHVNLQLRQQAAGALLLHDAEPHRQHRLCLTALFSTLKTEVATKSRKRSRSMCLSSQSAKLLLGERARVRDRHLVLAALEGERGSQLLRFHLMMTLINSARIGIRSCTIYEPQPVYRRIDAGEREVRAAQL
jgi:hypothetical protein